MTERIDRSRLLLGTYILDTYARTERHVKELKECEIDLVVCLRDPSRELLDLLQKYGIGCVQSGVVPGWWGGDGDNAGTMAVKNPISKYVQGAARFVDHPAVWMIDVGDEPSAQDFDHYGRVCAETERLFPHQLPYLNLYPNYASVAENTGSQVVNQLGTRTYAEHIEEYVKKVGLPYISYDFYVYPLGDNGLPLMYDNYRIVADACRRTGRDLWFIPQCNGRNPEDFTSANMMRFQAYTALAYGAAAINWACWTAGWWHNFILDSEGNKTEQYAKLQTVNRELRRFGERYMDYRSVATHLLGFADNAAVRSHPALGVKDSLDCGFARELRAEESGSLCVGEMVHKNDPSRHALLIVNVNDYRDRGPSPVKVSFRTFADDVKLTAGGEGVNDYSFAPAPDGSGARICSFVLDNCHAALIEIK